MSITSGAIAALIAQTPGITPTLQVLDVRKVNTGSTASGGDRHKCVGLAFDLCRPCSSTVGSTSAAQDSAV